jgi:hypothetical protein
VAIIQTLTTSFKAELLLVVHDFRPAGDVFKLALYTSLAALDASTTSYTPVNEAVGTNYPPGGNPLTNLGVTTAPGVGGYLDFDDLVFPNVTLTARGAMIYNSTPSAPNNGGVALINPAVAILDFGSDKIATVGDFTIIFPAPTPATAIIRII